ncbi:conserved Plasmodium protein, unknown function [Plasmodium gaboni]|uniref:EMP1-like protein n=1 Tax=Plasmodium gaboni TaxID=647221 RepID=A0ABY1UIS5_9APIC|nr:conserved Plasmodium protein, unknown function [Plasmodium gaboni]
MKGNTKIPLVKKINPPVLTKKSIIASKNINNKNDQNNLTRSEYSEEARNNDNTICESVYENAYSPDSETFDFVNENFNDDSNQDMFPYESYMNKEKNYKKKQMMIDDELIFQNEMLRNVFKSSQKIKEMQRELFNVDTKNFIPVVYPVENNKGGYSIPRDYSKKIDTVETIDMVDIDDKAYGGVKSMGCPNDNNSAYLQNNEKNNNLYDTYEGKISIKRDKTQQYNTKSNKNKESILKSKLDSHVSKIGEIKVNIDDIKTGLLSYYSNVFSLDEYDIGDRINILRYGEKRKNTSDLNNVKYSYEINDISIKPSYLYNTSKLHNSFYKSNEKKYIPNDYYYNDMENYDQLKGSKSVDTYNNQNIKNSLYENMSKSVNKYDHYGQIAELLTSLKNKCDDANFKVQDLSSRFCKYENPDNRFWVHNLVPEHLRKPALYKDDDLRKHLVITYSQLFNEAMLNKKKIEALEKKLHILKLRVNCFKNGYKMETRNAL